MSTNSPKHPTSIRMSLQLSDAIKALAKAHHRSESDEIVVALEQYIEKEKSFMSQSSGDRPCILSVECPPDEEEFRSALESLRALFGWVQIVDYPQHSFLCAAPKNGLSYDECFILCQQRFGRMHGIGWVYADAVGR